MKAFILTLFLTLLGQPDPPVGVWIYKPDTSSIEISGKDGKLWGTLVSSRNSARKSGTALLKDFVYKDGFWQGKLYLEEKGVWVDATLKQVDNLLIVQLTYGMVEKKIHFHRRT